MVGYTDKTLEQQTIDLFPDMIQFKGYYRIRKNVSKSARYILIYNLDISTIKCD